MYKTLLILKYLRKRRIAWVSLIAVMLCTAMVLIVISVMGGWLEMFRQTNHALVGDVIVSRQAMNGFAHYEEMIDEIQKLPQVKAAAPLMRTYGLANIGDFPVETEVIGVDLKRIQNVNGFVKSLYLQPPILNDLADKKEAAAKDFLAQATTQPNGSAQAAEDLDDSDWCKQQSAQLRKMATDFPSWDKPLPDEAYRQLLPHAKAPEDLHGIIMGSRILGIEADDNGHIEHPPWIYQNWVKLTSMRHTQDMTEDPRSVGMYWIIDDSRTGVYLADSHTVYVPFEDLQAQMDLNGQSNNEPPRCNEIEISVKDGVLPDAVVPAVDTIVQGIINKYGLEAGYLKDPIVVETWEQRQAPILSAVENEKGLLVILFAIISVVAIFLIFCIFFMIVVEKTRDIGIIKSVGATGWGVAAIFLGYGLAIGIVGSGLGLLLGYLVVHNINELHRWLGTEFGVKIWDARTYVFDTIPNKLEPTDVMVIAAVAIISSVLGALVPAIRAARMNPVEALRWE
jgi:lipoprotein-releasing system permease protein